MFKMLGVQYVQHLPGCEGGAGGGGRAGGTEEGAPTSIPRGRGVVWYIISKDVRIIRLYLQQSLAVLLRLVEPWQVATLNPNLATQ